MSAPLASATRLVAARLVVAAIGIATAVGMTLDGYPWWRPGLLLFIAAALVLAPVRAR